ncbi:acetate--CoA ligase [Acetobacteraceae bacterium KSS8]|uniref:Acetate--CoA ligase n=1 Tax=Endosaccharibacter trunci TaxID=2812733 RepID=A0ABT1W536_9PROT|nr:acetate--CoA ligase [Acetobacteraceae bacterium KSS8]
MSEELIFHVKPQMAANAHVTVTRLGLMQNHAMNNADAFWLEQARRLDWMRFPTVAGTGGFGGEGGGVQISWFGDGVLNASVNCLDRHLAERGDATALIWQGEREEQSETLSFRQLHERVCRLANVLKRNGVGRGDRVAVYLPMVADGVAAMLACARIGAVHVVMFAGFSSSGVASRIRDSGAKLLITADEGRRGGKTIPLKRMADAALAELGDAAPAVVLVARVTGSDVPMQAGRDHALEPLMADVSAECEPEPMGAEDPLLILYTSGSTGAPKGVLHTTGGYLLWASLTQEIVFDHRPGDVFWCTADLGWVTGHSYVVYGPLANGGATLLFEGTPSYPEPGRWWQVIDRHAVTGFYTAPTAIRALMRDDPAVVERASLRSLRVLGSVGEPINPEAWLWFYDKVGHRSCPVMDSWWQTETGGIMIAPLPGAVAQKPGSATLPLPGVRPLLVNEKGEELKGEAEGHLCIAGSWPGQARTLWGDHPRFEQTYFSTYPGLYFSGDGARRDADGYFWITGRVDDVINVSGHRIGSAEVESAFATHEAVGESAVIGVPDDLKGQSLAAFVVLRKGAGAETQELPAALSRHVGVQLGRYAAPDRVVLVPDLPKTRSGKVMRRILRKIATGEHEALGDVSTLADPGIVEQLVRAMEASAKLTAKPETRPVMHDAAAKAPTA